MGILDSLFGSKVKETPMFNWIQFTDKSQLKEIIIASNQRTQVIFKHSTRCVISRSAIKDFEFEYDQNLDIDLYYLDLLNHRDISDEISNNFSVMHQSPQILVIKNGVCVYNESHEYIDASLLSKYE